MLETLHDFMLIAFGGDAPEHPLSMAQVAARGAVVYIVGLLIVRIGKSRLIARNSPLDVILGFILGSLLSRGITGHAAISETLMASLTLVAVHWVLTAGAVYWHPLGKLFKGNFKILFSDGEMRVAALRKSHLSVHDLYEALRQHGLQELEEVERAYKERSGDISIIPKKAAPRVLEVGVQAGVQTVRLVIE